MLSVPLKKRVNTYEIHIAYRLEIIDRLIDLLLHMTQLSLCLQFKPTI